MSASPMVLDRGGRERREPLIPSGIFAMLLFVFTEVMLFAGLISAHVVYVSSRVGEMWPPPGQPLLPFAETAVNTVALILSGLFLVAAQFAFSREGRRALLPLGISVLLGLFFVGFQGVEWLALIGEGLTLTSSTYGAFFYLIVGAHAIHAVVAVGCLVWALLRMRQGRLDAVQFGSVQVFWYFVVLVWPVVFFQVYQ